MLLALMGAAALVGTAKLPADAPVYLVIRPGQLADDMALLNLAARTQPDVAAVEDALRDTLGFDLFRRADWVRIGIDPETPVAAALLRTDPAELDRLAAALGAGRKPTPSAIALRHRLIARVADQTKWKTFLGNLARAPWGSQVRAQLDGDLAVVDFVTLPGTGPLKPAPPAAPRALGFVPDRGAARLLGDAPLSAYVAFDRLPALMRAQLLIKAAGAIGLARPRSRARIGQAVVKEARECADSWGKTGGALFDDFAIAGRVGLGAWEGHSAWGLSALGKLGLATSAVDDGVLDVKSLKDPLVVGQLFVPAAAWRAVPRMGVLRDLAYASRSMEQCGDVAGALAALRFWPQLAAFALDEASRDAQTGPLVSAARNAVLVVRDLRDPRDLDLEGSLAVTLDLPAGSPAEQRLCPSPRKSKQNGRELTLCAAPTASSKREQLAWETLPGGTRLLAWLSDGKALDWWTGLRRGAPQPHPSLLASFRMSLSKLFAAAGRELDPMARALIGSLVQQRQFVHVVVRADGDLLRGDLRLDSTP
ncbi:MAG TPA: hypothetical protein VKN99_21460 [Polyangia bacterium]|nr:hypothetical protein [Polyangia bacterium]